MFLSQQKSYGGGSVDRGVGLNFPVTSREHHGGVMVNDGTVECYLCKQPTTMADDRLKPLGIEETDDGGRGIMFVFLCEECTQRQNGHNKLSGAVAKAVKRWSKG